MNVYHNYWPIKFLNVTLLSHFQLPVLLYLKVSVSTLNPQKENVSLSVRFIRKTPVAFIVFGVLLLMFNLTLLLSCSRLTNLVISSIATNKFQAPLAKHLTPSHARLSLTWSFVFKTLKKEAGFCLGYEGTQIA